MNYLLGDPKSSSSGSNNQSLSLTKISNLSNNLGVSHIGHAINNSQEACLICGDVASGKHYGLRSCEACKAFFKRTVQGKIEYSCPAAGDCEINKRRRKACQACRFQKCLNMGMLKEGVRLDRVRGGRQKYRRGQSPVANNLANANISNNSASSIIGLGSFDGNVLSLNTNELHNSERNNTFQQSQNTSLNLSIGCSNLSTAEANRIMTALINCEPDEQLASPEESLTSLPASLSIQMKTLYILSDLFDRELVSLIGWAKQIPGFSENLTLNDQMRLLQSTWAEVIALSIGYRSHLKRLEDYKASSGSSSLYFGETSSPTSPSPTPTASCSGNALESTEIKLVFARDLILDFNHAVLCGAEETFYNCVQLTRRLDSLKLTPKEFIILKAICLTNADVHLENPKSSQQLRDLMMETLYEVILSETAIQCNDSSPTLRACSLNAVSQVSSIQNILGQQETNNELLSAGNLKAKSEHNNQYDLPSPSRPSSSMTPSSSPSSMSSQNNNMKSSIDGGNISTISRSVVNNRMNQILLCLPVLRQIDNSIRKFWNDVRRGPNDVPMNKLFEEMLDTNQRNFKMDM